MENIKDLIEQQAADALQVLGIQDTALCAEVAESILRQAVYWEKLFPNDKRLLFIRLFSPVVMREEVFLGNVLCNAFLSQAFARAVTEGDGRVALIANDLENYYFLVHTSTDLFALAKSFRAEVERSLPELFFGQQNPAKGIFGSVETMLDFDKANVEPFPVFIMPQSYMACLEKAVRESILCKIEKSRMERNPTSIMANLAFFYSHDGAEMQSPYLFLVRLALKYGILGDELWQALNLDPNEFRNDEAAAKKATEESLKQKSNRAFSPSALRHVLQKAVLSLGEKVDSADEEWLMPYIRAKFLPQGEKTLAAELLAPVRVGYITLSSPRKTSGISCRMCGVQIAEAEDKSILMGQNTHKFHNQSGKQKGVEEPKACLRCATCTYLMVKLLGSEAVGQPQVPKTYNLIFHYGRHSDEEVVHLAQQIDRLWELVSRHREMAAVRSEVAKAHKAFKQKANEERDAQKRAALEAELAAKQGELQQAEAAVTQVEDDIFANCPWMRDIGASPVPSENPALDVLGNLQLSESKVERHVLGLGMGGYRMILFVLPQIRPPRDAKAHDFAQSRFSNSWITVTAFLSFLHNLCGCDGPFYYQSLPTLTADAFQPGTFYIRNRSISAQEVQARYNAIYQLAWNLVWQRGSEGFVKKVVLAEKLLADPMGTFSTVMRDSPILGQQKGGYKRLKTEYRRDWGAWDLTEYARFIQQLESVGGE